MFHRSSSMIDSFDPGGDTIISMDFFEQFAAPDENT